MLIRKQYQSVFVFLLFLQIISFSSILSQNPKFSSGNNLQASIQLVPFYIDVVSPINEDVKNTFKGVLEDKNVKIEKNAYWELALYAEEDTINDEIKISVTQMASLPEIAIQLLAENEVYYKSTKDEKIFPEEGKVIRQELTKEHMYNYRMPRVTNIIKVNRANLKKACEEYVDSFLSTRLCNRKLK